jgi:hypothetical protein
MGNKCFVSCKNKDKSKAKTYLKEKISKLSNSLSKNEILVKSSPYNHKSNHKSNNNDDSSDSKVKFANRPIQDDFSLTEIVNANTSSKINNIQTKSIRKETKNDLKNIFNAPSTSIINYLGQDVNLIRSKNKQFEDFYFLKTISSICESTESNLFLSIRSRFGCNSESGLKELNKLVKWQRTKVFILLLFN